MEIHKSLTILTFIILIFLCGCSKKKVEYEDKSQQIAKDTLNQLKLDYKEDFEIESITYTKENDSYVLFVHPKSEPDISFRVIKWAMGGNDLIDNYIPLRRALQTRKLFKPFAENISSKYLLHGNITGVEKNRTISGLEDQIEYWEINYPIKDFIKKYHKNTRLMVDIFFFFDLNENNKEEVCKKVFEMVKYIQSLEVAEVDISIQFYDEDFFRDKDVVKINEEEMGPAGMMNFQTQYYDNKNINIIFDENNLKEFKRIKSYKDIEKKIWYKEFTGEKTNIGGKRHRWVQK